MVLEDDYDDEFRFDHRAIGALQGLAPDSVIHLGSTSKSLAPALPLRLTGVPAGVQALATLPAGHDSDALVRRAAAMGIAFALAFDSVTRYQHAPRHRPGHGSPRPHNGEGVVRAPSCLSGRQPISRVMPRSGLLAARSTVGC
ncbi:hypothetical protein ACFYZB_33640 [Streptomyces sp. NPDC001852]|uniref:hypothetical protein n=1 Tax=Streptomyces sp. NPDC001852 TaxID=3364619 RepID=UPI0036CE8A54